MVNKHGAVFLKKIKKINGNVKILCMCNICGRQFEMWDSHFRRGSNGCECRHMKKHNKRLYGIWVNMKSRCYNPNMKNYENYGGRGITICDEWKNDFKTFYDWSIVNGYADNLTIDRIDFDGNYEPSNCRWANVFTQANNKRNNVLFIIDGNKFSLKEVCDRYGLNYKTEHTYLSRHGYECEKQRLMDKLMELEKI